MRARALTVAQVVVALAMVPTAIIPGLLGTYAFLLSARAGGAGLLRGLGEGYAWAFSIECLFADAAAILALTGTAFLIRWMLTGRSNRAAIRFSVAGAACYWGFVIGILATDLALKSPRQGVTGFLMAYVGPLWLLAFLLAVVASLVAWGLRSRGTGPPSPNATSRASAAAR